VKLIDLNPRFLGSGGEGIRNADGSPSPRREGIGVIFNCPCGCKSECFIPFANPLDGGPAIFNGDKHVWQREGDTFEMLTLTPSILRIGGCAWHGFITKGAIIRV
jgi:hypothetical protein